MLCCLFYKIILCIMYTFLMFHFFQIEFDKYPPIEKYKEAIFKEGMFWDYVNSVTSGSDEMVNIDYLLYVLEVLLV